MVSWISDQASGKIDGVVIATSDPGNKFKECGRGHQQ